jgi:hypothetical protein
MRDIEEIKQDLSYDASWWQPADLHSIACDLLAEVERLRGRVGTCTWWEYSPGDSYQTACKHDVYFSHENAREQGYRYCPWCGRRIEYKVASDD